MKEKYLKISGWKRILAFVIAIFLCVQSIPYTIYQVWAGGENAWDGISMSVPKTDKDGTFLITTGAELAWFANEVNKGNGDINGRLQNTIWLNNHDTRYNWIMIGNHEDNPYRGTFDGNGQRINYLYAAISQNTPQLRYAGLFGVIDGGTVFDLTVSGTIVHRYATYGHKGQEIETYSGSGGIAGYLKRGKIASCINYTETLMDGETKYRNAGGITGICSGSVIRCTNRGKLSTSVNFAQRHIGGIAGMIYSSGGQVRYCDNRGSVQGYFEVGGIAGAVKYGGEIHTSCNYGDVTGNSMLGGIVGNVTKTGTYSNGTVKECMIRNVYSIGTIGGTTANNGTVAGGIIGQMGYEDASDEGTPSMPILENAYATIQYVNDTYTTRGAIIGYFKSGSIGNVYGMEGSELSPCASEINKTTSYTGTVAMKTETNLKSVSMIKLLGTAFVKTNKYDYDNYGFPKLAWQGQTSDLAEKVDTAIEELNGWKTEANRLKYGTSYQEIENVVERYTEEIAGVVTEEDFDTIMKEAREALNSIKPGTDNDNELTSAIDEGILTLEDYFKELKEVHPDWTEEQVQELNVILDSYIVQLDTVSSIEQVTLLVRGGKDALDAKAASYEEEKRLEEIRLNAIHTLEFYQSDVIYGEPWDQQIAAARAAGLEVLEQALTVAEVRERLSEAQTAIDDIINQIPGQDTWDGTSMTEPKTDADGVYQIGNGAELAWFANQINTVSGMNGICGELTGDINLGNKNWTPIGGETVYIGTFDGNEYKVRGLKITEGSTYAGLFGAVYGDENQSIVNLTVSGSILCGKDVSYAGGIVAYIYGKNGTQRNAVENCHSEVSITIGKVTKNDSSAGGIAGYARDTWFRNCSNKGTVCIDSAGKGGIQYFTGGIVGNATSTVSIRRCYNAGYIWADFGAGGIAGKIAGSNCELTSNYNCGEVQAITYAGGLVALLSDGADGSIVKWSYSSGAVNLNKSGEFAGAIAGSFRNGTFENVYALKRSDQIQLALIGYAADSTASGSFVSSEELQRDSMLNYLNNGGNYFIHDYLGFQNGYPILCWQLTLDDFKTGAVTELETFVKEEEYTPENWITVQSLIEAGIEKIWNAADMEEVNVVLTGTREAVYEVESIADAYEKQLEEAKDAAVAEIQAYVDLILYREEEQTRINIYISDAIKSISLAESLEKVAEYLTLAKDNIDRLPTEAEYIYEQDLAAAAQVDSYILNIGEVLYTDYVKTSINIARKAYDVLTDSQKMLVTQYQVLLDAEAAYALLKEEHTVTEEDQLLASLVDDLIAAIGEVTLESGDTIQTARYAYDALTDLQKTLVTNPEALPTAEAVYDELRAREVSAIIASIGEVTLDKNDIIQKAQEMYDSLSDAQKALVIDYDTLSQAKITFENLLTVQTVIDIIDRIGTVTIDSGSVIKSAISAYNALTAQQQAMVTNYYLLEAAAVRYDSLQEISRVELYIDQIGAVNESSGNLIKRARMAYDALDESQKKEVSNLNDLEAAEKAYQALWGKKEEEKTKPVGSVAGLYQGTAGNMTGDNKKPGKVELSDQNESLYNRNHTGAVDLSEDGLFADEYVPVWEDYQDIDGESSIPNLSKNESNASASIVTKEMQILAKRKENIFILGIVFVACTVVTATMGAAVHYAGKRRKEKMVHY